VPHASARFAHNAPIITDVTASTCFALDDSDNKCVEEEVYCKKVVSAPAPITSESCSTFEDDDDSNEGIQESSCSESIAPTISSDGDDKNEKSADSVL
jgi:hypothetical protein